MERENVIHEDIEYKPYNGCLMLFVALLTLFAALGLCIIPPIFGYIPVLAIGVPLFGFAISIFCGLFTLDPNEACLVMFYGKYKGICRDNGFNWINPLCIRLNISLKIQNFESKNLLVNDKKGNPINIAAVVVWRVSNPSRALFDVENYNEFIQIQSESAIRNLAFTYPFDRTEDHEVCLKDGTDETIHHLKDELQRNLEIAGIVVDEARITHLSYSAEIANVMLKKQQAESIIAARKKIVEGAVGITGMALQSLATHNIAKLTKEDRARIVSNLLVVLCGDTQNSGI